jgi:hypothetical protein
LLTGPQNENCALSVFRNEKKLLRKVFWPKRVEATGSGEVYITSSFVLLTKNSSDHIKKNEMSAYGVLMGRDHLEDLSVDGRLLRWIFRKWEEA